MPIKTYTLPPAHSGLPVQLSNTLIFIKNDNLTLSLVGATSDTIAVYGHNDHVALLMGATSNMVVQDHGTGTDIFANWLPTNLVIEDFQYDHTGIVRIGHTIAAPTLTSDHHGGTLATFGVAGASIDFVGDKHVTASHVPGTIIFSG